MMKAFEDHIQWNAVKEVCQTLRSAGHEALLAGGCVRDLIMGREPNDFDVATDASPDRVEALFEKSVAVGKAFGVIILPFDGFQIEVATFREDLAYKDGRRPEGVKFSTAKADAQRRDFTVNALFFDIATNEIIDYVGGRDDIARRLLRTVGDPDHRFDEDKLRLLRAIRFSAQLDFEIEPRTLDAISARSSEVSVVSRERIRDELLKLLKASHRRRGLELLVSTGVLAGALPELAPRIDDVRETWLSVFDALETDDDAVALWALLLWPARRDPPIKSLRLDHQQSDALLNIFRYLDTALNPSSVRKGELAYLLTKPFAPSLLLVADTIARANALSHELDDRTVWNEALKAARPDGVTPVEPLVGGKDLMAMGLKPGPKMGAILHDVFIRQLEGTLTSRDEVAEFVKTVRDS
jgi:tRNA nucleotidyltransferase/poly(A) polymerase